MKMYSLMTNRKLREIFAVNGISKAFNLLMLCLDSLIDKLVDVVRVFCNLPDPRLALSTCKFTGQQRRSRPASKAWRPCVNHT